MHSYKNLGEVVEKFLRGRNKAGKQRGFQGVGKVEKGEEAPQKARV